MHSTWPPPNENAAGASRDGAGINDFSSGKLSRPGMSIGQQNQMKAMDYSHVTILTANESGVARYKATEVKTRGGTMVSGLRREELRVVLAQELSPLVAAAALRTIVAALEEVVPEGATA